ncbi:MAG TPA: aminotransferase class I/II-fold pyridoxal phosphate-dependent enzyme, partial [Clostridia bacterium]|nr:aminotransferase class I/II-fold pyridoxal phosphate-dependent enzyme [Clostridia bacterium]
MKLFRSELKELSSYVPGKPLEEVMEDYGLSRIIKLASNENPLGPSPLAIEAVKNEAENMHLYPDPEARLLKRALAEELGVSTEQILFGNGGEATIQLVAASVIEKGDEVVVPEPGFALHEISTAHMGGIVKKVPLLPDYSHDLEGMLGVVNEKTKIVFLTNPNNPTGVMIKKEELEDFAARLPEQVLLFIDEAYFEFAKIDPHYPDGLEILKKRKNTLVLRTFAKVCGIAGIRLGYIVSTPEIIKEVSKSAGVFSVNRLAQVAGLASLKDKEHIEKSVALARASLARMM